MVLWEVCVESRGRGIGPDYYVGKVLKEGGSNHSLPSGPLFLLIHILLST